jgi:TfoX/Sxy family transcriptional regulator of competence genes
LVHKDKVFQVVQELDLIVKAKIVIKQVVAEVQVDLAIVQKMIVTKDYYATVDLELLIIF